MYCVGLLSGMLLVPCHRGPLGPEPSAPNPPPAAVSALATPPLAVRPPASCAPCPVCEAQAACAAPPGGVLASPGNAAGPPIAPFHVRAGQLLGLVSIAAMADDCIVPKRYRGGRLFLELGVLNVYTTKQTLMKQERVCRGRRTCDGPPTMPPPPLVAIFFAPTYVPQSDQCDEAAISHHICRGLEPPRPL